MVNVLIVNAYSARNRGDGMIVHEMIRLLKGRGASVKVMSDDPADVDRYGVDRVEPLVPYWPVGVLPPSKWMIVAGIIRRLVKAAPADARFSWPDLCVSAGGGYLYDDGRRGSRLNLLLRLLPLRAARRRGIPVVLFSQSVGPFASRFTRLMVARELRRARLVIVRERNSLLVCQRMGIRSISLCDDVAFALSPGRVPDSVGSLPREAVGVTVMNSLPGVGLEGYQRYRRALAEGIERALEGRQEPVLVISQVAAHAGDSDVAAAQELTDQLRAAGVRTDFIDLAELSNESLSAFYGRFKVVVASRLHSGILGLCAGTPVVGLSYLPKTHGVLERAGLPELVLPAQGLDAGQLAAVLRHVLDDNNAFRKRIGEQLPILRESAASAVDLALRAGLSRCQP